MELKLATRYEVDVGDILLIVPYGIETFLRACFLKWQECF